MFYKREKGICRVIKVSEAILRCHRPSTIPVGASDSAEIQLNSEKQIMFIKVTSFSPN